jgi:hypothetical protein
MVIFEDEEANRFYSKQATIHRSNSEWTMSRLMERLGGGSLLGRVFATARAKLREMAERLGVRHVVNLAGFPAR